VGRNGWEAKFFLWPAVGACGPSSMNSTSDDNSAELHRIG